MASSRRPTPPGYVCLIEAGLALALALLVKQRANCQADDEADRHTQDHAQWDVAHHCPDGHAGEHAEDHAIGHPQARLTTFMTLGLLIVRLLFHDGRSLP